MFVSVEGIYVLKIGGVETEVQQETYLVWLEFCSSVNVHANADFSNGKDGNFCNKLKQVLKTVPLVTNTPQWN